MVQETAKIGADLPLVESQQKTRFNIAVIFLPLLIAVAVFSLVRQQPPAAVGVSAPPNTFSSGRAMTHVNAIAKTIHPMGSAEHTAVREYLVRELTALGVAPQVQAATVVSPVQYEPYVVASVQNVMARLPGTEPGAAMMLVAHYDSAPTSYGASDDGAGVAALLETIRALKAEAPLKNDVIFLFTDGEEVGLMGAAAFVERHPWAKDVKLVLNFEARGSGGQAVMFETSPHNGRLISEFAAAAPKPSANSLMYEVYRLLPNDTDLSIFKRQYTPGMNFAFIDDSPHYHTSLDSIASLDERSLQHQGEYALALSRRFGNTSLDTLFGIDAVYFDVLGLWLVHYSYRWVLPLALLVVGLFAGVVILGFRRGHLSAGGMTGGFFVFLLTTAAVVICAAIGWRWISGAHGGYKLMTLGETYNSNYYRIAFVALAIAITAALYGFFGRKMKAGNLIVGALVWWLLLLLFSVFVLPGGSFMFFWPLLFALGAILYVFKTKELTAFTSRQKFVIAVCAVPGVIVIVPLVKLLFVSLSISLVGIPMLPLVLLLGLVVPLLISEKQTRWVLPATATIVAIVCVVMGSFTAKFDNQHKQPNSVLYSFNADTGKAIWASNDDHVDEWTQQFLPNPDERTTLNEAFPLTSRAFMKGEAPALQLAAPEVRVVSDETNGEMRSLRLQVNSPRRAPVLSIYEESEAEIASIKVADIELRAPMFPASGGPRSKWGARYFAVPEEGIELKIDVKASQPLKLRLVDQTYGLPETPASPWRARPESMMPAITYYGDAAFVSKSFTF